MNDDRYDKLKNKYDALLEENEYLKAKIRKLESQQNLISTCHEISPIQDTLFQQKNELVSDQKSAGISTIDILCGDKSVNQYSPTNEKISLFMSLFKGRNDVYAKKWQNKKGFSGYSPHCLNEWTPGICNKPRVKCSSCNQQRYSPLNESAIERHLRGAIIIGIYPMEVNETCNFLAIDFDKKGWEEDISVIRDTCSHFDIPVAIERSQSGNGCHAWFFFDEKISAVLARKFGTSLLTYSMNKRHKIPFRSYDRLFPNQDTMPKGGFGNLIALPLQKRPRANGNSVFIGGDFMPYPDQWIFLSNIEKLNEKRLNTLIKKLSKGNELGVLKDGDSKVKPWKKQTVELKKSDFPETIKIVRSSMLYVEKNGLSQRALNTPGGHFKIPHLWPGQNPPATEY
jgi:hypothetical protein